jgi:hypothetical protein
MTGAQGVEDEIARLAIDLERGETIATNEAEMLQHENQIAPGHVLIENIVGCGRISIVCRR